ncbi:MAG: nucleotidyltransferase domain-containing protein [Candidatus Woesearchaeota archaeon]
MAVPKPKDSTKENKTLDANLPAEVPDEARKKLEELRVKLDLFKDKVLEKFSDYCMGITLLPPTEEEKKENKVALLVLMDDSDSTKMSKLELKEKLFVIVEQIGKDIDKRLAAETVLLSELWQACYDAKYELINLIATGATVFDKGMLAAIKISEIHKNMVLKKFEKYIVAYVLAGSLVQGKATPSSDIDVYLIIDDTDVKKMTRVELKDKLRAIIIGMGIDAGKMTGIENKINIQVYILTDFWDYVKEANPIIFTLLRDGIPFYDRGIFMPWKQLLKMGRVKPSPEAIDMFMRTGDQMIDRIKWRLKETAMEDLFYAVLTPSQAALMMFGEAPPTPKEAPDAMKQVFVTKKKLLEPNYIEILKRATDVRKQLEHGTKKEVTGKEIDTLLLDAEKYIKRLGTLFEQIEVEKEDETIVHLSESINTTMRDVLRLEGVEQAKDEELQKLFKTHLVDKGLAPQKYTRILKEFYAEKEAYEKGGKKPKAKKKTAKKTANSVSKTTKTEIHSAQKKGREILKFLIEYVQRKRGRELEQARIRVKHGDAFGEVLLLGKEAYIIHDIDHEEKNVTKATITPEGGLTDYKQSNPEELEKAVAKAAIPERVFIKERIFEDLKSIFGKDVEILMR